MEDIYSNVSTLLFILLVAYVAGFAFYGIFASKEGSVSSEHYFAAKGTVGGIGGGVSLWATLFSAGTFVGGAGFFYTHGIGTLYFTILQYLIMGLTIYVFGRMLFRRAADMPENIYSPISVVLGKQNRAILRWVLVLIVFFFLIPYFSMQFAALGKLISSTTTISYPTVITLAVMAFIFYSFRGGLPFVIRTDWVQATLTVLPIFLLCYIFLNTGWSVSFSEFITDIDEVKNGELMDVPGPFGLFSVPFMLALGIAFGLAPIVQPQSSGRFISADSEKAITTMSFIVPIGGLFAILPAALFGLGGAVVFPDLNTGDEVLPAILSGVLPVVAALVLIGIVSATISTIDSLVITLGGVFSEALSQSGEKLANLDQKMTGQIFVALTVLCAFAASLNPPDLVAKLAILSASGIAHTFPVVAACLLRLPASYFLLCASITVGPFMFFLASFGVLPPDFGFSSLYEKSVPTFLVSFLVSLLFCGASLAVGQLAIVKRRT